MPRGDHSRTRRMPANSPTCSATSARPTGRQKRRRGLGRSDGLLGRSSRPAQASLGSAGAARPVPLPPMRMASCCSGTVVRSPRLATIAPAATARAGASPTHAPGPQGRLHETRRGSRRRQGPDIKRRTALAVPPPLRRTERTGTPQPAPRRPGVDGKRCREDQTDVMSLNSQRAWRATRRTCRVRSSASPPGSAPPRN